MKLFNSSNKVFLNLSILFHFQDISLKIEDLVMEKIEIRNMNIKEHWLILIAG